jgi:hypothetical protein
MPVMTFTIELDIGLSYLLQAGLPLASDRSRDNTHRRGRIRRSSWPLVRATTSATSGTGADALVQADRLTATERAMARTVRGRPGRTLEGFS